MEDGERRIEEKRKSDAVIAQQRSIDRQQKEMKRQSQIEIITKEKQDHLEAIKEFQNVKTTRANQLIESRKKQQIDYLTTKNQERKRIFDINKEVVAN